MSFLKTNRNIPYDKFSEAFCLEIKRNLIVQYCDVHKCKLKGVNSFVFSTVIAYSCNKIFVNGFNGKHVLEFES